MHLARKEDGFLFDVSCPQRVAADAHSRSSFNIDLVLTETADSSASSGTVQNGAIRF